MNNIYGRLISDQRILDLGLPSILDHNTSVDIVIKTWIRKLSARPISYSTGKMFTKEIPELLHAAQEFLLEELYENAITACTTGLQICIPYSTFAADFYNFRAKALENLGLYRESLSDVDRTIELGFITDISDDLHARKQKLEEKIASAKPVVDNDKNERKKYFNEIPVLSGEENKGIPGASDAIGVAYDREYRFHFVAKKLIKAGDVIFIEKPYMNCVNPDKHLLDDAICDHCNKTTKAPIPCEHCSVPLYCSKECLEKAYKTYGNFECSFIRQNQESRILIKVLVKITDNGAKFEEAVKYCEELESMDDDTVKKLNDSNEVLTDDMKWILNLSLRMKRNWALKLERIMVATGLALTLRNFSTYAQGSNDILGLAKLILRILFIVETNCLTIENPDFEDSRAHGLYRLQSMVFHSCYSNTMYTMHKDNVLALRATRDIKPGEKISYNSLAAGLLNLSSSMRQMILLKNNNVACKCIACIKHYTFMPEIGRKLDVPKGLQRKLRRNKKDVNSMWELLKLINTEIERPCFEAEAMKIIIRDTYLGEGSGDAMWVLYHALGV